MPFALIVVGLLLVITGARGTQSAFASELKDDLTGNRNFIYWLIAIGSIGALGYVESFRSLSRWFMALIIIVMVVKNEGFFDKLMEAIASGPVSPELPASKSLAERTGEQEKEFGKSVFELNAAGMEILNVRIAPNSIADRVATAGGNIARLLRQISPF